MAIVRIVGELKLLATYNCQGCKTVAVGETIRTTVDASSIQEANEQITSPKRIRAGFPVGWASFDNGFKCSKCLHNREK